MDISARYKKSNELIARAERVIPLGSQTFSKGKTQFPQGAAPLFLTHGLGGRTWDVDGNEYVDLVCGLMANLLGHCDPDVDAAIKTQMERGISFSTSSLLECELAERLTHIIPCAEKVRFGKNGTDATSAAIRLARAYTNRDRVIACGYHGWQDWSIGSTVRNKGIPGAVCELTSRASFNDIEGLERLFNAHPGEFAAVILEPAGSSPPAPGYLESVRLLTHKNGALFIMDEIVTGFRLALGGAQEFYGVIPDLATIGKGMANGMPISAVVGRADVMREMEDIFFSTTFGGEALSLAAAIAVIDKMRSQPVIGRIWRTGEALATGAEARIAAHGLEKQITLNGLAPWKVLGFHDHPKARKEAIKTLFLMQMLGNGVLINASHNVCYAHSDSDVEHVLSAYDASLQVVADELKTGQLEERLGIPVIMPVFSVRPAVTRS